jgi:hypothetical protein
LRGGGLPVAHSEPTTSNESEPYPAVEYGLFGSEECEWILVFLKFCSCSKQPEAISRELRLNLSQVVQSAFGIVSRLELEKVKRY